MANIRKHINQKGISWKVDFYLPGGKRIMRRFKLRRDAELFLAKVQAAIHEDRYPEIFQAPKEKSITFNELADHYQKNFQHQKSWVSSKKSFLQVLRKHFGHKRLSEITYLDLETFRNTWLATPIKSGRKPRSVATVNRYMATLRHMLQKAMEWGFLEVSPFQKGARLTMRENNQRDRFLSEAEIDALLRACPSHLLPVVETALHTGMRRGEILGLQWDQIKSGLIYLKETKSNRPRQIPIDARLEQVFQELRIRNKWKSTHVFLNRQGEPLKKITRDFQKACRRAGIEERRFHDLRHTFASHLVMRGASIKAVQKLLGHSESRTTDSYSHLAPDHLRDAVGLLENLPHGKKTENNIPLTAAN
jgi:integrase